MYYIWRQSIQQREQDEILLTSIKNLAIIILTIMISDKHSRSLEQQDKFFGGSYYENTSLLAG